MLEGPRAWEREREDGKKWKVEKRKKEDE